MNILLLSSEYAPARGGIGTYAHEIALAATQLGARVTLVAPDYAQDMSADDRAMPFAIHRFSGGLHSARDLPAKIMLARSRIGTAPFDVVHAADWPFFIPVALARGRTPARMLMTVHGTEINETQTPLKRLAIRFSGVFGPRTEVAANSNFTRELFRKDSRSTNAASMPFALASPISGRAGVATALPRVRSMTLRPAGSSWSLWRGSRGARDTTSHSPHSRSFLTNYVSASPGWSSVRRERLTMSMSFAA